MLYRRLFAHRCRLFIIRCPLFAERCRLFVLSRRLVIAGFLNCFYKTAKRNLAKSQNSLYIECYEKDISDNHAGLIVCGMFCTERRWL